mgnify:CR=1 FL=1
MPFQFSHSTTRPRLSIGLHPSIPHYELRKIKLIDFLKPHLPVPMQKCPHKLLQNSLAAVLWHTNNDGKVGSFNVTSPCVLSYEPLF